MYYNNTTRALKPCLWGFWEIAALCERCYPSDIYLSREIKPFWDNLDMGKYNNYSKLLQLCSIFLFENKQ